MSHIQLEITVYAIGIEIKFRTVTDWLVAAKGNMVTAILGKLLPYTIIYILIGWLANYVMFGILHIPFQGSWWLMNICFSLLRHNHWDCSYFHYFLPFH